MKQLLYILVFLLLIAIGCGVDEIITGSVFDDHTGTTYDDGSGLADVMDGKSLFFGNLHSHTAYSDGEGTPGEAFAWARDTAGYDFYAVTDHAEQVNDAEWLDTGTQADTFNADGTFTAIRGFEWSSGKGHICVWGTGTYTSAITSSSLSTFNGWLDDQNALAEFNHPDRFKNKFNSFSYDQRVTDNIIAIETGNKSIGNISGNHLRHYPAALSRGWRLAPASNQDNHTLTTNSHRTVILADGLNRTDLFEAMKARRFYSSDDPDFELIYKIGAHWMGEVVNITAGTYEVIINAEDDEAIRRIEIIDRDNTISAATDLAPDTLSTEWRPQLEVTGDNYYYVKVYGTDSNNDEPLHAEQIAVTAPIWLNVE